MNRRGENSGQVWVETVIYTLIALVIIGLVLSFIQPKIQELQDKAVLQQSISILNNINSVVSSVAQAGPGNKRQVQIGINKGSLIIDGVNNEIVFTMNSHYQFSEPGYNVSYGNIIAYTQTSGNLNIVNMTLNYTSYNMTYNGGNKIQVISQSSTPYNLFITNNGGSPTNIDFSLG